MLTLFCNCVCCCLLAVSLDPDDEKLLEEEPVNLPDKKRYEWTNPQQSLYNLVLQIYL